MIRILLILILVSLSNPTFADVEFHKLDFKDSKGHEYVSLKLTGHLKISDVDEFKKYIKQIHKEHLRLEKDSVELDSHGGIRGVGMDIGRIIRKEHISTYVAPDSTCSSSCVWVLVGGVCRMSLGDIGVHRTLELHHVTNNHKINEDGKKLVFKYLEEMEVPPDLGWLSITTPQWLMSSLSEESKSRYGLYGSVTEEQDTRFNVESKRTKLSKRDLKDKMSEKYMEINPDNDISEVENHISCTEQLYLEE